MSLGEFINNEEMTFEQGALVVAGWFAIIFIVGIAISLYAVGI